SLEARLILGAAVIDDVIGLVILGVVSALAAGTAFSLQGALRILGVAVAFLFVALWIGLKLAPRLFGLVDRMRVRGVLVVSAFAFLLLLCVLAERAGTALIIGAFAVGLIFAQIGLTAGILSNRLFSAILFVVIATTLVTPPLLQLTLRLGATLDEDSVP